MKKSDGFHVRIWLFSLMMLAVIPSWAEDGPEYITVSGVVRDARTKKKLEFASIYVPESSVGTIANIDGEFSIKIRNTLQTDAIMVTHVGYASYRLPVHGQSIEGAEIYLERTDILLDEALVPYVDPLVVLREAMRRIGNNYAEVSNLFTGFYRETIQKRRHYISISEAVVDVFKTPYDEDVEKDYVQIYKGRMLASQKSGDTLLVKLQGGPHISIFVDVVKNSGFILNTDMFTDYKFWMENSVNIDDRPHFVVAFKPQIVLPYALHCGKFYIDKQTFTFSRAEINLSMDDKSKATQAILRKKPFGLRFKPEEVSYLITYKEHNGRSYIYYVRNEVHFKCDWKRKLFSTNYRITSEMVFTDRREFNKTFRLKMSDYQQIFKPNQIFSERVADFLDPDYWENYNIIAPSESLETAVKKLRRQQ